jgi:hypothetical protein
MNKPIEVRGKKNKQHGNRHNPQDELKQILSGTNEEIAAASTIGVSPEEVAALREAVGQAPVLQKAEILDIVRDGVLQQEQAYRPMGDDGEKPAKVHVPLESSSLGSVASASATLEDAVVSLEDAMVSVSAAQASGITAGLTITPEALAALSSRGSNGAVSAEATSEPLVSEREERVDAILQQAKTLLCTRRADIPDLQSFLQDLAERLEAVGLYDNLTDWVKNQAFINKNLILVVLRTPKSIPAIPEGTIKQVLEMHPAEITGLARGYNLGTKAGNRLDYTPNRSEVQLAFGEKYGRVLGKLFETWGERLGAIGLSDNTTVDFMLIEPDPTHTLVVDAWKCSDMYPAGCSSIDAIRDSRIDRSPGLIYVPWGGVVTRSAVVDAEAQVLLSQLILASANPYVQPIAA